MSDKLSHALRLAEQGFRIHPLIPNDKRPLLKKWQNEATTDESTIRSWWAQHPDANIGVATGRGLVVLDFDVRDGGKGLVALDLLDATYDFPDSARVTTASGGVHVYLSTDQPVAGSIKRIANYPDMDVKSDGGYVVGPGSTIDGKEYSEWKS